MAIIEFILIHTSI